MALSPQPAFARIVYNVEGCCAEAPLGVGGPAGFRTASDGLRQRRFIVRVLPHASEKRIIMTALTVEQVLENIYASLKNDNEDIDTHIQHLKAALAAGSQKTVEVDSARLVQNNRSGRKLMQSYFKKRGVIVTFSEKS